jgi:hypothetical protein
MKLSRYLESKIKNLFEEIDSETGEEIEPTEDLESLRNKVKKQEEVNKKESELADSVSVLESLKLYRSIENNSRSIENDSDDSNIDIEMAQKRVVDFLDLIRDDIISDKITGEVSLAKIEWTLNDFKRTLVFNVDKEDDIEWDKNESRKYSDSTTKLNKFFDINNIEKLISYLKKDEAWKTS